MTYVVRARNDNAYVDSTQSSAVTYVLFEIKGVIRTGAGGTNLTLSFTSNLGATYRVDKTTDLSANAWTDAGVTVNGNGGVQTITVPSAGLSGKYFFRVVQQ